MRIEDDEVGTDFRDALCREQWNETAEILEIENVDRAGEIRRVHVRGILGLVIDAFHRALQTKVRFQRVTDERTERFRIGQKAFDSRTVELKEIGF